MHFILPEAVFYSILYFTLPSVPDLTLGKVFKNFLPEKTLINCLFQTLPSVPDLTPGKFFDFFKKKQKRII
jgi:hypothetical protein